MIGESIPITVPIGPFGSALRRHDAGFYSRNYSHDWRKYPPQQYLGPFGLSLRRHDAEEVNIFPACPM